MADHVDFALLGIANGAVFAALAMALVSTYRSSGVVNFAVGAASLHAAYTYAFLRRGDLLVPIPGLPRFIHVADSVSFWPALFVAVAIEAVVGALLYLAVFRLLRPAPALAKAVASLGVMFLLTAILSERVDEVQVVVERIFPAAAWELGGVRVAQDRAYLALTVVAVAVVLALLFRHTRFGMATRAAAESEVGAVVSGLRPERIALANWVLSFALAGLAGVLIAPLSPLVPGTYTLFVVPALAAAVLGRFISLGPAVVGAIAIGMFQSEAVYLQTTFDWMPSQGAAELVPLALVLVVLVARGQPLPGRGELVARSVGRAPRPSSWVPLALVPVGALGVVVLDNSYRTALIVSFIMAIFALSLVVVTGYAGQISLAQLTLGGVAGFLLSGLTDGLGVPFPVAPLLAAVGAAAIGVVLGLPALRTRGIVVAIVTLTIAVALEAVWFRNNDLNGGTDGAHVTPPSLFGLDLGIGTGRDFPRPAFGIVCLVALTLVAAGVARLRTSRLGSAMLAVRADERAAAAAGVDVVRTKLIAFGLGAFVAGLGGAFLAYKQTTVTFDSYAALAGLALFATAYLAGITSVSGGIVAGFLATGGLVFVAFDRAVDIGPWYDIAVGAGLILTVLLNPEGLVGPAHELIRRRRRRAIPARAVGQAAVPVPRAAAVPDRRGPILEVRDLTVSYGGVTALNGVSFSVARGEIVGLIGPNGAGKTTLMDRLSGFAHGPGTVWLAGAASDGLPPHKRAASGLGRTFQTAHLYEDLSVHENTVVGARRSADPRADVEAVLALLDLTDLSDELVEDLTPGRRQLVSVARALASRPAVLLLDEPAGGLDSHESRRLGDRLRAVRDAGTSILLVEHDMELVLALCDTVHVLALGELIASGPPDVVRADPGVMAAYFGEDPSHGMAIA